MLVTNSKKARKCDHKAPEIKKMGGIICSKCRVILRYDDQIQDLAERERWRKKLRF